MKMYLILSIFCFLQPVYSQTVEKAWVKQPIPGMKLTGAYMTIKNSTLKDIDLIAVEGPDAEFYEIHTHTKVDGVMKMRQLKKLTVPSLGLVTLKPKSFHIMLIQIKKGRLALKTTKTKFTLIFDNEKKVEVNALVSKEAP